MEQTLKKGFMGKPVFNPEVNWGHILVAASFLASVAIYTSTATTDVKHLQRDVAKHDAQIAKLIDTENEIAKAQLVISTRLADHIEQTKAK